MWHIPGKKPVNVQEKKNLESSGENPELNVVNSYSHSALENMKERRGFMCVHVFVSMCKYVRVCTCVGLHRSLCLR